MIPEPLYWLFEQALSDSLCDSIIEQGLLLEPEEGTTGNNNELSLDFRKSTVGFFDHHHWVEGIASHFASMANNSSGWNINLIRPEKVQFTSYEAEEYYHLHEDTNDWRPPSGLLRKLSVVVQLSDPEDYEGGSFEFAPIIGAHWFDRVSPKGFEKRGSVLVFPSFVVHGVKPVTKGLRRSMVAWILGPSWV